MSWEAQVNQYIDQQVAAAQAALQGERAAAEAEITAYKDLVLAKERQLASEVAGFRQGIIAPAYRGMDANVLERDPLRGIYSSAPPAPKRGLGVFGFVILGGLAYLIFKKRRKK